MAWVPPVTIPDLGGKDYAGQLYGMVAGVGDSIYGVKRDKIADAQWEKNYARGLANDERAQSNADRDYALELERMNRDLASGDEYGLNGVWGYNPESGKWGYFQPSKGGGAASQVEFPEGFEPQPPTSNANLGTSVQPVSTRGGIPTGGNLPIDVAGASHERELGGAGGKIAAALPVIEQSADRMVGAIDDLLQDPMLPYITGPVGGNAPTWMSSDPGGAYRAQAKVKFILGNVFLQAYNDLRGAGQITEREGQAAMEAYSRLTVQGQDDAAYRQALMDLRNEIVRLTEIARQRAQMGAGGPVDQSPVYTSPGGFEIYEGQ